MAKVLYFTAGDKPTGPEQTAIDDLLAGRYDVGVRNASESTLYGTHLEPCDFVAGDIPTEYDAVPEWAGPALPADQTIVTDGAAFEVPVTGTYIDTATVTVEDGALTAIVLS